MNRTKKYSRLDKTVKLFYGKITLKLGNISCKAVKFRELGLFKYFGRLGSVRKLNNLNLSPKFFIFFYTSHFLNIIIICWFQSLCRRLLPRKSLYYIIIGNTMQNYIMVRYVQISRKII